jgi:hypothetical protein
MDFYQAVVGDYLRADRSVFINTECCIQLNAANNPDDSGVHWYCDAVAVDLRKHEVFLCEISFAKQLGALKKRLKEWAANWDHLSRSLERDCSVREMLPARPWLFVPTASIPTIVNTLKEISRTPGAPNWRVRITPLEKVQPWLYHSWEHQDCNTDKSDVPVEYRA